MTISAKAFARDEKGGLMVFQVTEAESYEHAIELVKSEIGNKTVLCLVEPCPEVIEQPTQHEEAVA